MAVPGLANGETSLQAIVDSASSETVKFYWKVSSASGDYLKFYIDGTRQDRISGEVGWQQKSYAVNSGIHILKWRYGLSGPFEAGSSNFRRNREHFLDGFFTARPHFAL